MLTNRLHSLFIVVAFSISIQTAVAEDSWPQFRGPDGQGHSQAANLPLEWSTTKNITWKTPIPGKGWSSPILLNGAIYLTTATQDDSGAVSLRAVCVDAKSGKIKWNNEVFRTTQNEVEQIHSKNSLASPTPVTDGLRVYVHYGHMGTAALSFDGAILWRQTELKYPPLHGTGSSPVLSGNNLILNCDAASDPFVAALDCPSGAIVWKTPRNTAARNNFSFATPLVIELDGKKQIISPASGFVGGYEPKSGEELWRVRYGDGYSVVPRPLFAHGILYVCSGFNSPNLYAINPKGASGDATNTNVVWEQGRSVPKTPSPIIIGDEIYFVSDNGVASCLDAKTGEVHWRERLDGDFSASPMYADAKLYFPNETGTTFVVEASKTFKVVAKNDLGETLFASPIAINETLYLRTESHLWKIEKP